MGGHPFEIHQDLNPDDDRNHLGIYANRTLHFSIEENNLYLSQQGAQYEGHGVLVFNSQGANNQIYKNNLENLKTGINGWQVNLNTNTSGGVSFGHAGLQYICNTNANNEVDFEISRSDLGIQDDVLNAGIRLLQGNHDPEYSASNQFSIGNPDPSIFTHFTIQSPHNYNYFSSNNLPSSAQIGPGFMGMPMPPITASNSCPSNYTTGRPTGLTKRSHLLSGIAEYEGMVYTYNQTIDQGNTPGMITQIELTWPTQAWELRDELIDRSPYNSEEVLIAAIHQNIMPHAMLMEVLLANPDALQSGHVIQEAETAVSPPLPEYMIDLLVASRDQTTLRTTMERILADLHEQVQYMLKIIITEKAFADSISSGPDSTLYYLSLVKTVEGNYTRAAAYADRHMYSHAIDLLDSMQTYYRLNADRDAEMTGLKSFYEILYSAHNAGQTIANLDGNHVQSLIVLADNPTIGIAASKAQHSLCFHYGVCYDMHGQLKIDDLPSKKKPSYSELIAELNTSSAYPNPSDQYITIAYSLLKANDRTKLSIVDNLGRQIEMRNLGESYEGQQLIDTRKLANGMYFYQISQDGKKVSEGKFVVTH